MSDLDKLNKISDQIVKLKKNQLKGKAKSYGAAAEIQRLERKRAEIRGKMDKLKLVHVHPNPDELPPKRTAEERATLIKQMKETGLS